MNTLKLRFLSVVLVAASCLASCGGAGKDNAKDYFATAGITVTTFSNAELNDHFKAFETLYNKKAAAAEQKDKEASPALSLAFSDWLLQAMKLQESLPATEQKKMDEQLELVNKKWNELQLL